MPTKTITGGALRFYTQFGSYTVAAESGTADNLDNVTLKRGGHILIQPDSGDTITLRDTAGGTGNLRTPGSSNLVLADTDVALLEGDGTLVWVFAQATGGSFSGDAFDVAYTPTTGGDWTEGAPSEVGEALDILAARTPGSAIDAADVTYTPADGSDPGNVNDALDDTRSRIDTLENAPGGGTTISRLTGTVVYDSGALGSAAEFDTGTISLTGYFYVTIELLDARAQASVANADANLTLNADTTEANYTEFVHNNGSGSTHGAAFTTASRHIANVPGASATTDFVAAFALRIPSPAGAKKKLVIGYGMEMESMSTGFIRQYSVAWNSTAAITRIQLAIANATTTFAAGSRLIVTGWKTENILTP